MSCTHLKNHRPDVFVHFWWLTKWCLPRLAKLDITKSIWLPAVLKIRRRLKFDSIPLSWALWLDEPPYCSNVFFLFAQNYYWMMQHPKFEWSFDALAYEGRVNPLDLQSIYQVMLWFCATLVTDYKPTEQGQHYVNISFFICCHTHNKSSVSFVKKQVKCGNDVKFVLDSNAASKCLECYKVMLCLGQG